MTKKCEYCKKKIPDDKYRCETCHYAYSRGFDNGKASARREIGVIIQKCLNTVKEDDV
jgi:hypothetical protein